MKVMFVMAPKAREERLAESFGQGLEVLGDELVVVAKERGLVIPDDVDAVSYFGVKGSWVEDVARMAGKQVIYLDKGYFRNRLRGTIDCEFWRVVVNDNHPVRFLGEAKASPRRWEYLAKTRDVTVKPWRTDGEHVLYCGSSPKFHEYSHLDAPHDFASDLMKRLKKHTNRKIVYRPKPNCDDTTPVRGVAYSDSKQDIQAALRNAWCLVVTGSNACFEAMIEGIPTVVLGNAAARPISSTTLEDVESPYLASDEERLQWFSNLAWANFTNEEYANGLAWRVIKQQLEGDFVFRDDGDEDLPGLSQYREKIERHHIRMLKRAGKL